MLRIIIITSIVGLLLVFHPADSMGQSPSISWFTIDGGGGQSTGDGFELIGTSGQADAVDGLIGGGFTLTGGFNAGFQNAILLGDVNLDGAVNLLDIDPFIDRIGTGTFQDEADCNQDGEVNLLDVESFIAILSAG